MEKNNRKHIFIALLAIYFLIQIAISYNFFNIKDTFADSENTSSDELLYLEYSK